MKSMKSTFLICGIVIVAIVAGFAHSKKTEAHPIEVKVTSIPSPKVSAHSKSRKNKVAEKKTVKQLASAQSGDDFSALKEYFRKNNDGFAPQTHRSANENVVSKDAQYFVMSKTATF